MIDMYVRQVIVKISSENKESEEAEGGTPIDVAVIRFSGVDMPDKIEDVPSVIFGRDESQYALLSVQNRIATFVDATVNPIMYVTAGKSPEDPAVYVAFPFSQPTFPDDAFLDVEEIGGKIVCYAQSVNPNSPYRAAEYIPGFLIVQREVDQAEERAREK